MAAVQDKPDPVLEALLREYVQLTTYGTQAWLSTFNQPPLVFVLGAALLASRGQQAIGFALPYAIFFFAIWLGFTRSTAYGIEIYLVDLEERINQRLGVSRDKGVGFVTCCAANPKRFPGLSFYYPILGALAAVALLYSFIVLWGFMTNDKWSLGLRIIAVAVPAALNSCVFIALYYFEQKQQKRMKNLRGQQ